MKKMKNETMNAVRLISVIFLPNLDVSVDTIFLKKKRLDYKKRKFVGWIFKNNQNLVYNTDILLAFLKLGEEFILV